jgi:hypothetical protein
MMEHLVGDMWDFHQQRMACAMTGMCIEHTELAIAHFDDLEVGEHEAHEELEQGIGKGSVSR